MKRWKTQLAGVAKALSAAAVLGFAAQAGAADITWDRLLNADKDPNNWLMYHGSYKGWHYSALDQINKNNVKNLKVAWIHSPSTGKRGIQSFPLVADGILYYTSTTGQIWALDAASGAFIWSYKAKIDEERANIDVLQPVQPRRGHRLRQGLHGHGRRPPHRSGPEDRPGGVGQHDRDGREGRQGLHRRTA